MKMYGSQMAERFADTAWNLRMRAVELKRNATKEEDHDLADDLNSMARRLENVYIDEFKKCRCGYRPLVTSLWEGGWMVECPTCEKRIYRRRYTMARDEWNGMLDKEGSEDA